MSKKKVTPGRVFRLFMQGEYTGSIANKMGRGFCELSVQSLLRQGIQKEIEQLQIIQRRRPVRRPDWWPKKAQELERPIK